MKRSRLKNTNSDMLIIIAIIGYYATVITRMILEGGAK